jgi:glycine/D-amino acid oxidase-like deaminating enzyme
LALANAAERLGARIFESSRAGRVTGSRDGVSLRTPQGTVRCRHVVIATGSATPAFTPLLSRFRVSSTYVLATQPLPAGLRRQMRAGRVMFWDAERPYHYFRWTDDGRIVFGGGDRPVPRGRRARHAALVEGVASLKAKLCGFYPQLDAVKVSCAWDGLFATTPDALPYIGPHRRYPRHLFALGYGGNGMTFGFLAARILLRHCLGRAHPSDSLFRFSRF